MSAAAFTPDDLRQMGPAAEPEADQGTAFRDAGDPSRALLSLAETMGHLDARPHYSPLVMAGLVRAIEFGLLCATGVLVHLAYVVPQVGFSAVYEVAIPTMAAVTVFAFQALRINNVAAYRAPITQGFRLAGGWSIVVLAALAVIFFLKLDATFSRGWMVGWYVLALGTLLVERGILSLVTAHMTRTGRLDRRTVVVGGGPAGAALLEELSKQKDTDLRIIGVFDDRTDAR